MKPDTWLLWHWIFTPFTIMGMVYVPLFFMISDTVGLISLGVQGGFLLAQVTCAVGYIKTTRKEVF